MNLIDIRASAGSKNPNLLKWVPKFVWNWLAGFIHEKELNDILIRGSRMSGLEFSQFSLDYLGAALQVSGLEHIPSENPCIVAANHPLGGLDGLALIAAIGKKRTDSKIIVNDLLLAVEPMKEHFIGVNKFGQSARQQLKEIEVEYAKPQVMALFPSGYVSRVVDGKIQDIQWTKAFISKAKQYNKPIIPCFIEGQNSPRFYRIAVWRKRLGIKANLEMFTLPDEMTKQKGKTIHIRFGPAILPEQFDKQQSDQQWADKVRDYVYTLQKGDNTLFSA
jgi:putative hemolysin